MSPIIRGFLAAFRRPAFVVCVVLTGTATLGLEYGARKLGLYRTKLPIPLRAPLRNLDRQKLSPYRFQEASILPPEMVESLGTDQYIHWILVDTSRNADDATRIASLFVTYYTGQPDPVPHVPDVCYLGGGYQQIDAQECEFDVPELEHSGLDRAVPFRAVSFGKPGLLDPVNITVCYLFSANGALLSSRDRVRLRLGSWSERYAYFSKVEVTFQGKGGRQPTRDEAIEAAKRLLRTVLPILAAEHWPDWQSINRKPETQADRASAERGSHRARWGGDRF